MDLRGTAKKILGERELNIRMRLRAFNKIIKIKKEDLCLDVGGGMGVFSSKITKLSNNVVEIDPEIISFKYAKEKLSRVNKNGKLYCIVGNGLKLPFKSNTFDNVICFEVIEHVPKDTKLISELIRVLKEQGTLYLSTPLEGLHSGKLRMKLLASVKKRPWLKKLKIWDLENFREPAELMKKKGHLREYNKDELIARLQGMGVETKEYVYTYKKFGGVVQDLKWTFTFAKSTAMFPFLYLYSMLDDLQSKDVKGTGIMLRAKKNSLKNI